MVVFTCPLYPVQMRRTLVVCCLQLLAVSLGGLLLFILQPFHWENANGTVNLVRNWKYPIEKHRVVTDDGYIIEMQRIPGGRDGHGRPLDPSRLPVLLQHGLLLDSSNFVTNLPHQSLAFLLADNGHDVWLGNSRGNFYGSGHVNLSSLHPAFWDFTWEDMAEHDIPAIVDKVLNVTGHKQLNYIGHSQGALTMLAQLSDHPEFGDKIRLFFGLAPAASVVNIRGPIATIAPLAPLLHWLEGWVGPFGIFRRSPLNGAFGHFVCMNQWMQPVCSQYFYRTGGQPSDQVDLSRLDLYISTYPDATSSKNIVHFGQMVLQKRTAHFDYGSEENLKRYGHLIAPAYDFSRIRVPLHFWYSPDDYLTNDLDFHHIVLPSINPEYLKLNASLPKFNHFDFHWGLRAPDEIYRPIMNIIDDDWRDAHTCYKTDEPFHNCT